MKLARASRASDDSQEFPQELELGPGAEAPGREIVAESSSAHRAFAIVEPAARRRRPPAVVERDGGRPLSPGFRRTLGLACAATLLSLVLAGRERIVAKIPATDRAFAAVGLPVNLAGVEFRNVISQVTEIDGGKVLAVSGEVVNIRRRDPASLAKLEITVRAEDGRALYVWTTDAPKSKLQPGESAFFRTRLAAPPEGGREVAVTLTDSVRPVEPLRQAKAEADARAMK